MSEINPLYRNSEQLDQFAAAMAAAQQVMGNAIKDSTNPHFKSRYADLASVRAACAPLSEVGIAFMQFPSTSGKMVTVVTLLVHKSGQWVSCSLTAEAAKTDPQSIGSAITYLRRYGLLAAAGLATDDDDGEAAVRPIERREPAPVPRPSVKPGDYFETSNAFEGGCRAAKFSLEQVDAWLVKQGKKRVATLDADKFAEFTAWLFGPSAKAAEARAQIGAL